MGRAMATTSPQNRGCIYGPGRPNTSQPAAISCGPGSLGQSESRDRFRQPKDQPAGPDIDKKWTQDGAERLGEYHKTWTGAGNDCDRFHNWKKYVGSGGKCAH